MNPVLLRVVEEAHQALPVPGERRTGLGVGLFESQDELVAFTLARRAALAIHHRAQPLCGLGLRLLRQRVQHVHDLVVPAALLIARGMELPECCPDAEVPVGHRQARELQSP